MTQDKSQPSAAHHAFTGSVPPIYDRHLGPVIFAPYADDLASRLRLGAKARVLEVACGTGIVTSRLLARLGSAGRLVATDLNQGMLDHARSRFPNDPRLELRVADAQQLPFPDVSFDHYVCQFGIMFFPDKVAALREAARVLAKGGEVLVNTWGTLEQNSFARIGHTTIARFFAKDPPTFYLTPFGWHDQDAIRAAFHAAGFASVQIDVVDKPATAVSAADFAIGIVRGNPIAVAIQERLGDAHERVIAAVASDLAREGGDRPWRGQLRALVVRAVK
ncbi:MAG TPA: methyltransferase domain-containing protein [Planctomycetota bacterium]|nr:methyltransferase domain-containing protein [Planctomycetota bacterium]